MKIFSKIRGAFALMMMLVMASLVPTTAATAGVTIFFSPGINSSLGAGESIVCDFDATCANKLTGNFAVVQGTTSNWAAPQGLNTSKYWATPGTGAGGVSTLDLAWLGPITSFSIEIGSIDTYNSFLVSLASGFNFSFSGSDLISSGFGNQMSAQANGRVNVIFDNLLGETVNTFTASSTQRAAEVDNIAAAFAPAAAVPEPGTWAMLILGFGFAGGALRRRRAANDNFGMKSVAA